MIIDSRKILFLHPTKTGGTSVEIAFLDGRENLTRAEKEHYAIWHNSFQHLPVGHLLQKFPRSRNYRKLVTVRHPYDRVVSEFNYQRDGHRDTKKRHCDAFYKHNDINGAILSGALWVCQWPWHGAPQSWYLTDETEIMRAETLSQDWAALFPDIELPHTLAGSPGGVAVGALSDEAKKVIQEKFENDFNLLSYVP